MCDSYCRSKQGVGALGQDKLENNDKLSELVSVQSSTEYVDSPKLLETNFIPDAGSGTVYRRTHYNSCISS
jgi:hypothetical protein